MYFPDKIFLPFIQKVDRVVTTHANDEGLKKRGKNRVEVTTEHVKYMYSAVLESAFHATRSLIHLRACRKKSGVVYAELVRKLCNTRLQEFLDSYMYWQRDAPKTGSKWTTST